MRCFISPRLQSYGMGVPFLGVISFGTGESKNKLVAKHRDFALRIVVPCYLSSSGVDFRSTTVSGNGDLIPREVNPDNGTTLNLTPRGWSARDDEQKNPRPVHPHIVAAFALYSLPV